MEAENFYVNTLFYFNFPWNCLTSVSSFMLLKGRSVIRYASPIAKSNRKEDNIFTAKEDNIYRNKTIASDGNFLLSYMVCTSN